MRQKVKYRIRCTTDNTWKETGWLDVNAPVPTTCPSNGAHTIDTSMTVIVDTIETDVMSITGMTSLTANSVDDDYLIINDNVTGLPKKIKPNELLIGPIYCHSDVDTKTIPPTTGQYLKWDGSNWVPDTLAADIDNYVTGGTYNSGNIDFVGTNGATTFSVDVSTLLDDTNTFVTGSTLNGSTLEINLNDASQVTADLSSLLDDTNLARITGGTESSGTLTLTRDDNSSFNIDLSGLLDDSNTFVTGTTFVGDTLTIGMNTGTDYTATIGLSGKEDSFTKNTAFNKNFGTSAGTVLEGNTTTISAQQATDITTNNAKTGITPTQSANIVTNNAKISADGSIDTHSDVDTTTVAPNTNEVLTWNGSNWIPGVVSTEDNYVTGGTYNSGNIDFGGTNGATTFSVDVSTLLDDTNLARITGGTESSGTLTLTRDDNSSFNVDLSGLIDDTNLARVTGGTESAGTLTLTRSDNSTINIDLSGLLDDTDTNTFVTGATFAADTLTLTRNDDTDITASINLSGKEDSFTKNTAFNKNFGTTAGTVLEGDTTTISAQQATDITTNNAKTGITPTQSANIITNNAKVSADGSIDTHSDVDTTTVAPSNGEFLKWNGTNWVPGTAGGGGDMLAANNLSDVANATTSFNNIKQSATTTYQGVVELATDGETLAGKVVQGNDARLSDARTPLAHNHDTADITTGTFADARIASSNVTQHEASINHDNLLGFVANEHLDWTTDLGATNLHVGNITSAAVTQHEGSINHDNLLGFVANEHLDWTTDLGATNIHNNNILAGAITQHEGSLTITSSQVSDFSNSVTGNTAVVANTAKVTNATHTGEVTGSGTLTIDPTAITNKTTVTGVAGDFVLISDTSDSGNLKKVDVNDFLGGGGGSSESVSEDFTKTSHGLAVGDVVKHDGPNPEDFSKAQADVAGNSQAVGIVSTVAGNDFTVTYLGKVTGLAGLTTGVNYLSDATAGAVTATEPSGISKPILFATSATEAIIMIERGMQGGPQTVTSRRGHTWGISGEIKVPSGDTDFLIPFFVDLATGETAKIVKARYKLNSGTSATVKIQKNDVDATGFTGISVTPTAGVTDPADISVISGDKLALVVTGVSGTPKNMTFTLFIEYTAS